MHCSNHPTCECLHCMLCSCEVCKADDEAVEAMLGDLMGAMDDLFEEQAVAVAKGMAIFERVTHAGDMHVWLVFDQIGKMLGALQADERFTSKAAEWITEWNEIIDTTFTMALTAEPGEFRLPDWIEGYNIVNLPAIFLAMQMFAKDLA